MRRRSVPDKIKRMRKILRDVKYRCKKKGIPFDLTLEDLDVIPDFCPVLGTEINYKGGRKLCICSPSIDRLIPEMGYVKANCRIISYRANRIKSDASLDDLYAVIDYIRSNHYDILASNGPQKRQEDHDMG